MDVNPYAAPLAPTIDVSASGGVVRVGFWPRVGAGLIDALVTSVVGVLISGALAAAFPEYLAAALLGTQGKLDPKAVAALPVLSSWMEFSIRWMMGLAVVAVVYHLLTEGLFGWSLGKLLLGLRIADTDARQAGVGRLLGRAALKELSRLLVVAAMLTNVQMLAKVAQVPSLVFVAGCFLVFASHRRALHDLAAGTAVYRASDVTPR
jgi:uncharacterized RDD family membrane protein YckC